MMRPSRQQRVLCAFFGLLAMPLCAFAKTETPLVPPFPSAKAIQADPQTPPAEITADGLLLPIDFSAGQSRQFWDIPIPRIPSDATAITLVLSCHDLAPIRGLTVHLRSGKGWHSASANLNEGSRMRVSLSRGLFQPEDAPDAWEKSRLLRVSVWAQTKGRSRLTLHAVNAHADTIAIVRPSAPGTDAFVANATRLFEKAGIPFALIDEASENLKPYRLLVLPHAAELPPHVSDRLSSFVKRGGRLIVFFSASQPLGALLGIRPGTWQADPDGVGWTSMLFNSGTSEAPFRVPHVTHGMLPPFADSEKLHAKVTATWVDGLGQETRLPACVQSDRGAWFAHVPPLAYPAAATLIRKLTMSFVPDLSPAPPDAALPKGFKLPPPAMTNEIRAAWHNASLPSHPRGWEGVMPLLARQGINTLFLRWRGTMQGSFNAATAAGDKAGIATHAWVTCWTSEAAPAGKSREHLLMRDAAGNTLPWLCPSIAENRTALLDTLRTIARRGAAGIHLDYIRYPGATGCYAPATRHAFESVLGSAVAAWPADVLPGGKHEAAFEAFRRDTLTSFVREAREAVRAVNPAIRFSAAVFPTPESAAAMGQDWPAWIREGLLDFASPMIYTENTTQFAASLDACLAAAPAAALLPGLGTGADSSQLDIPAAAQQIAQTRMRQMAGFAFFAVDDALLSTILPALSLR